MKSWKENNILIKVRESVDTSLILTNPKEYFNSIDWTIPLEKYDDIINMLFQLMSKDTDLTSGFIGKNGRNVYKICNYLANNGKNSKFSQEWNKTVNSLNSKMNESVKSKLAMIALIGMMGLSSLNASPENQTKVSNNVKNFMNDITTSSVMNYSKSSEDAANAIKTYINKEIQKGNITNEEADQVLIDNGFISKGDTFYNKTVNKEAKILKQSNEAFDLVKNTVSKYHSKDTKISYLKLQLHNGNINQNQYNELINMI